MSHTAHTDTEELPDNVDMDYGPSPNDSPSTQASGRESQTDPGSNSESTSDAGSNSAAPSIRELFDEIVELLGDHDLTSTLTQLLERNDDQRWDGDHLVAICQSTIKKLQTIRNIEILGEDLAQSQIENADLKERITTLTNENRDLALENNDFEDQITHLRNAITRLEPENSGLSTGNTTLTDRKLDLAIDQAELNGLRTTVTSLNNRTLKNMIVEHPTDNGSMLNDEFGDDFPWPEAEQFTGPDYAAEIGAVKTRSTELEKQVEGLEKIIDELKLDLSTYRKTVEIQNTELDQMSEEVEILKNQMQVKEVHILTTSGQRVKLKIAREIEDDEDERLTANTRLDRGDMKSKMDE